MNAVFGALPREASELTAQRRADLAASFQRAAVRAVILKLDRALAALEFPAHTLPNKPPTREWPGANGPRSFREHDPAEPRVTGELKIPGYSAHLQPIGPGRLVGIGQDADDQGVQRGTQVSLFDVQDPAAPSRLAQHRIRDAWSEAEADAHAVLWWPATKLLVVPVQRYADRSSRTEALALRVGDAGLTRIGEVTHPGAENDDRTIRRTLVVGTDLWTVSGAGLQANDLDSLRKLAWLPA